MSNSMARTSAPKNQAQKRDMGKMASLSAFLGSMVEYYDFFLFGTAAALVFGPLFFAPLGETGALLASFATFGVAYIARPFGAVLFGGIGDKLGRKKALIWALNLIGISTFLVGTLPTYESMGYVGPIILVLLRLLQGLSAGGEQAGSNALSLEHAPAGKRGLYTSWSIQGTMLGGMLATLAFVAATMLPEDSFMSWGWRIPFLIAGPLMLIALYVRRQVKETESFTIAKINSETNEVPLLVLFRDYWKPLITVIFVNLLVVVSTTLNVFGLSFATQTVGIDSTHFLLATLSGNVVALLVQPMWAKLSDKVGRRPIMIVSLLLVAFMWFPYFKAIESTNVILIALTICLLMLVYSGANSVQSSFYAEQFPARIRFSGMAIGMQLGIVMGGFAPAIQKSIQGEGTSGWLAPAIFTASLCLISALGVVFSKETGRASIESLDK